MSGLILKHRHIPQTFITIVISQSNIKLRLTFTWPSRENYVWSSFLDPTTSPVIVLSASRPHSTGWPVSMPVVWGWYRVSYGVYDLCVCVCRIVRIELRKISVFHIISCQTYMLSSPNIIVIYILGGLLNESLWFMLFCNHEKCKRFVLCQRSCLCNASSQRMYVLCVQVQCLCLSGAGAKKKNDSIFPPSKFDASMFDRIKAVEHRFTK